MHRLLTTAERPAVARERGGLGWFALTPSTPAGGIAARSLIYWLRDPRYIVNLAIVPVVGPEPITGSTRMKSGTAQKLVLNMISTTAMIKLGYVKGNRMTNVKPSNEKLKERSLRILIAETELNETAAQELIDGANGDLRAALVMHRAGVTLETAEDVLNRTNFVVEQAVAFLDGKATETGTSDL